MFCVQAVTYNIVAALRAWARTTGGCAVVALLQPTPEVFNQFDDLMLLREGAPVYHGRRDKAAEHFKSIGESSLSFLKFLKVSFLFMYGQLD